MHTPFLKGCRFSVATLLLLLMPRLGFAQQANAPIVVGPAAHVSLANKNLSHDEMTIAADPHDAQRLLACSIYNPGAPSELAFDVVGYLSIDGGKTWSQTLHSAGKPSPGDPACAFGPDGTAYFAAVRYSNPPGPEKDTLVLYRSPDGGEHWLAPVVIGQAGANDRPFITIDMRPGKDRGALYIADRVDEPTFDGTAQSIAIYRSNDRGATFSEFTSILSENQKMSLLVPSNPGGVILPNGAYASTMLQLGSESASAKTAAGKLWFFKATSTSKSVSEIGPFYMCDPERSGSMIHAFAADTTSGPFAGRMYTAWPDFRSGRCEILFSYSTDSGKTWSEPFSVNDDYPRSHGPGPDNARPALAVNSNGVIAAMWYDRRNSASDRGWRTRLAVSIDGGETFQPSVALSNHSTQFPPGDRIIRLTGMSFGGGSQLSRNAGGPPSMHADLGYVFNHGLDAGDTSGLAASPNGIFHPLWDDNSTGIFQLWSTPVDAHALAIRNGSAALASLDDLTNDVEVVFDRVQLDTKNRTLSATMSLRNTSKKTLHGPLKMRILRVVTPVGELPISAHVSDFGLGPSDVLKPHGLTPSRSIVINLRGVSNVRSTFAVDRLVGGFGFRTAFARLDLKVLGPKP